MIKSYFKIAIRNIVNQKLYSVISIGGLALGLTCFMIILLHVQHEFSYNNFYKKADRIYRVYQKQTGNIYLGTDYFAVTPAQLATNLMEEFSEVTFATSVEQSSGLLGVVDHQFWEQGLAGDNRFFLVFQIPFIAGDAQTALQQPESIVLTKTLAQNMFGDTDPIGQSLTYQNTGTYTVKGVINDPPSNSSLQYTFIINILYNQSYARDIQRPGWHNNAYHTFLLLHDHADAAALEKKFPVMVKKYQHEEEFKDYPFNDQYFIQPLSAMYFQSHINADIGLKGNRESVYVFSLVALVVLLLACVNYMNLAVARSIRRSREVGLRKVVGAVRKQVIAQFMGESILITFFSLLLAVALTYFILPAFGSMMDRPVAIDFTSNVFLLPGLASLVLLVGIFSGSYPAFVMSALKPIHVLKTKSDVKVSGFNLQRILIVAQFVASITLVISSVVIYEQLSFIKRKELGYNKQDIITLRLRDHSLAAKFPNLQHEWLQHPGIAASTISSHLPVNITASSIVHKAAGEKDEMAIYQLAAGYDFLDVYNITLLAGRNFSKDIPGDEEQSYLLNETAVKKFGWTSEEAVGKQIVHNGSKIIIGVVKDFHMHSMHLAIQPLLIELFTDDRGYLSLKVNPEHISGTLSFIEKTIKQYSDYPFQYQFLDDNYNQLYQSESKLGEIFGFFTIVSILIASLGLFGLAAFAAGQRTKEIGIRKVLGASEKNIIMLLSKDFLSLVLVAFLVSVPVGWYVMHQWLQDFAYKIEMEWWMFAAAGALAFFIANVSVGYQSLKASLMRPVDNLRAE